MRYAIMMILLSLAFLPTSAFSDSDKKSDKNSEIPNLHLIDSNMQTGFAIYRYGMGKNETQLEAMCKLGIQEVMVLSGNADAFEFKFQSACPGLKVVFNEVQKAKTPLTSDFIQMFDQWVQSAQQRGVKIAFRCNCGCHRTGRLAAYYQIKYQGITDEDANLIMQAHGKKMFLYPFLKEQVSALFDYVHEQPCRTDKSFCVVTR
jgi:hypothetical protein